MGSREVEARLRERMAICSSVRELIPLVEAAVRTDAILRKVSRMPQPSVQDYLSDKLKGALQDQRTALRKLGLLPAAPGAAAVPGEWKCDCKPPVHCSACQPKGDGDAKTCTCPNLHVGMDTLPHKNLNPDCPVHGAAKTCPGGCDEGRNFAFHPDDGTYGNQDCTHAECPWKGE